MRLLLVALVMVMAYMPSCDSSDNFDGERSCTTNCASKNDLVVILQDQVASSFVSSGTLLLCFEMIIKLIDCSNPCLRAQGVPRSLFENKLIANGLRALWQVPGVDAEAPSSVRQDVIAIVTVNTPINAKVLGQYPRAKVLAVAFTGYGVHDLDACRQASVVVSNVPDYSSDSVAEMALALTLAVYRKIPTGDRLVRQMGWGLSPAGTELRGKTVGIAGTGTIGVRAARLFKAFGCRLIGWSRSVNPGIDPNPGP